MKFTKLIILILCLSLQPLIADEMPRNAFEMTPFEMEYGMTSSEFLANHKKSEVEEFAAAYFASVPPGEEPNMEKLFADIKILFPKSPEVDRQLQLRNLSATDLQNFIKLRDSYRDQEYYHVRKARDISLWIPNFTAKSKCLTAFDLGLIAIMVKGPPQAKVVSGLTLTIKSYIEGVYDAWDEMQDSLDKAATAGYWVDFNQSILDNDAKQKANKINEDMIKHKNEQAQKQKEKLKKEKEKLKKQEEKKKKKK